MLKLWTTTKLVKEILIEVPETRSSDAHLYYEVAKRIGAKQGKDILNTSFGTVLLGMALYSLPSFETVRRTRQKVQQHNKDLCACDKVEGYRAVNEETYKDYARSMKDI